MSVFQEPSAINKDYKTGSKEKVSDIGEMSETFFPEGYLELYPGVKKAGQDPWKNYIQYGKKHGRSDGSRPPESFFSEGYLELYPDVKESGIDPWRHYVLYGKKEGRLDGREPPETFFPEGYLALYPSVEKAGVNPWKNYVLYGKKEGRSDGREPPETFFPEGYLALYPSVEKAGIDPWKHYVLYGKKEGRSDGRKPPEDKFYAAGYLFLYPDVKGAGLDPWEHYAKYGKKEGRGTGVSLREKVKNNKDYETIVLSDLFDSEYYRKYVDEETDDIVNHFIKNGHELNPSAYFDSKRYLEDYPDVLRNKINPLIHYERYGKEKGRIYFPTSEVNGNAVFLITSTRRTDGVFLWRVQYFK